MTDSQAKSIATTSTRRGRKRARDLVVRVVSYFLNSHTLQNTPTNRAFLEASIRKALLDVGHPARNYEGVDRYIDYMMSIESLEATIGGKPIIVKL